MTVSLQRLQNMIVESLLELIYSGILKEDKMKKSISFLSVTLALMQFVVVSQTGMAAEKAATFHLPTILVEGDTGTIAGGLIHKTENLGLIGTKDVMKTPFQAITFDGKAIEQFSLPNRNILDVISFNPAVRVNPGATESGATIRGQKSNGNKWYLNGVPGMAHQKDMAPNFIGKITVIAGPAIGVRGTTASWQENAGGIVDMRSKRASLDGNQNLKLSFSGQSYFSQAIDLGKRFGKNKEWGVRVNALQGQGTLSVDNARMWKDDIYINIDRQTEKNYTNLLMGYDYTRQRGDGNSLNIPKTISYLPKPPKGSVNFSPSWAEDTYNNWTAILNHEQKLTEHARAFINAGYHRENYTSWIQGYSRRLLNELGDYGPTVATGYGLGYSQWPVAHTTKYIGIGVKGDFKLGDWKNNYVLSMDRMWFHRRTIGTYGTDPAEHYIAAPGNIYHTNDTAWAVFPKKPLKTQYKFKSLGWHLIDTITAPGEKLDITLGLHGHRVERAQNYSGGTEIDAHATSPTYALTYQITPQLMLYGNHSESFSEGSVVGSGYANYGETIPPAKTKQNEFGLKYSNADFIQTMSIYSIRKQGTNAVFENNLKYLKIDKEEKYKGIEYSAIGKLAPKLDMMLALDCIDARKTDGSNVLGLPKWRSTLAMIYKPTDRTSLVGRLDYRRHADIRTGINPLDVGSITTFDLGGNFITNIGGTDIKFSLMCNNVFNRHYWYSSGSSICLGMPRTISLTASMNI